MCKVFKHYILWIYIWVLWYNFRRREDCCNLGAFSAALLGSRAQLIQDLRLTLWTFLVWLTLTSSTICLLSWKQPWKQKDLKLLEFYLYPVASHGWMNQLHTSTVGQHSLSLSCSDLMLCVQHTAHHLKAESVSFLELGQPLNELTLKMFWL